jgi:hypothetical protein
MKDGLVMEVEGFEEVIQKLKLLREIDKTEYRDFKRGIKNAAKPFIKSVRDNIEPGRSRKAVGKSIKGRSGKDKSVTYKSGNLKRSIGYIKSKGRYNLIGYVGPRYGKKATKTGDGYYGAMVNFGTARGKAKAALKDKRNVDFIGKGYSAGLQQANALLYAQVKRILEKKLYELSTKQKKAIVKRGF